MAGAGGSRDGPQREAAAASTTWREGRLGSSPGLLAGLILNGELGSASRSQRTVVASHSGQPRTTARYSFATRYRAGRAAAVPLVLGDGGGELASKATEAWASAASVLAISSSPEVA